MMKVISNILLGLIALTAHASQFTLEWATLDAGGVGPAENGQFRLAATSGQPDAAMEVCSGGGYILEGGFWVTTVSQSFGDCDGDGDVDLEDFASFNACLGGPEGRTGAECSCFSSDVDADGDLDLREFAEFQLEFGRTGH